MAVTPTAIAGAWIIDNPQVDDERGFFRESYRLGELERAVGRPLRFSQGNHSRSSPGVLRGFHREPWDKLVYVVRGRALVVVADPRIGSPTFGRTVSVLLGDPPAARRRVFVAEGLANAFQAIEETDYVNEVGAEFSADRRFGFAWNDPLFAVEWPVLPPLLSDTDRALPPLSAEGVAAALLPAPAAAPSVATTSS
jgi:dTDP-4-dehydrorhamnose 3,5-epimerase